MFIRFTLLFVDDFSAPKTFRQQVTNQFFECRFDATVTFDGIQERAK
jgi:hypothetical protein